MVTKTPRSSENASHKSILVVRHAHRDTSDGRSLDNGLSERGIEQAHELRERFGAPWKSKKGVVVLSSPKARCVETVGPLAEELGVTVKIDDRLDEQDESEGAFRKRIDKLAEWLINEGPDAVIACSHGDLIPPLLLRLIGEELDLRKGAWVVVETRGPETALVAAGPPDA